VNHGLFKIDANIQISSYCINSCVQLCMDVVFYATMQWQTHTEDMKA